MTKVASWLATFVIALAALVGLIALINSRDKGGVGQGGDTAGAPGQPYRGSPVLSAAERRALRLGNVIVFYRSPKPPPGLRALGPSGAQLEAAGQSLVPRHDPRLTVPLAAVSASRVQPANTTRQLQDFVEYWLGGR